MASRSPSGDPAPRWVELFQDGRGLSFAILCLGIWLNAIDALVTATVMPSVAGDIGGYAYFAWATAGFMLGSIVAGAGAGLLGERVGLRRALCGCALLYAAGCVASALAVSIWVFLLGRLAQGMGAGFVVGLCYVGVRAGFPQRLWSQVFASLSGVWGVATVLGPLVGGLFAGAHLWRGVFWLFALQAAAFAMAARLLPRADKVGRSQRTGLPLLQLSVLTLAVSLIAAAAVLARPLPEALVVLCGLCLLGLALRLDARADPRLFPTDAARVSRPAAQGYATVLCLSAAAVGFSVYGAALLQTRLGLTPLQAGYVVASESIGWTLTALIAARAPFSWRGACIRCGAATVAAGLLGLASSVSSAGAWIVAAWGVVMGGGFGLCWSFVAQRILTSLPEAEGDIGSAAIPMTQILGNALGAAAAGVLADLLGFSHGFTRAAAIRASPILLGAFVPVALLGCVAAWRLGRGGKRGEA